MALRELPPLPRTHVDDDDLSFESTKTPIARVSRLREIGAILLGLAAMGAAMVAAKGPAIPEQAEFAWPSTLPAATPSRTWFTPLLLARHHPQSLDARVRCGRERPLADAGSSVTLFATARNPVRWNGLEVVRAGENGPTVVRVGRTELARLPAGAPADDCSLRIRFDQGAWSISHNGTLLREGTLDVAPNVSGLVTELDLRAEPGLSVSVRPIPLDTRPSARQTWFRILAAILLGAAMVLAVSTAPSPTRFRRVPRRPGAQDVAVAIALGVWWFLAPLQHDDGWVRARQTNSLVSGGFSNYYENWGGNLPLAQWLEWLQHFVVAHTTSLALHRLLAVAALTATWVVCRTCLSPRLDGSARRELCWWAAALAFVCGALAFGMTLRPEPFIALLAVGALACCLRYAELPAIGPLVLAVLLIGLAVTIHPSGVVAAAPFALCVPQLIRDARHRVGLVPLAVASLIPIGAAWVLMLLYIDTDTAERAENTNLIRGSGGHGDGVLQELARYGRLSDAGASPLRRMFVALLILVAVAFVTTLFKKRSLIERLPAGSVALALLFLTVTPSKWIWHFGALIGLCAVAVGFETHRFATTGMNGLRRAAIATAIVSAGVWATLDANDWGVLDTVRVHWSHIPAAHLAAVLVAAASVFVAVRAKRTTRPELVLLPAVLAALSGATVLFFGVDAVAANGWTASRQAVSSLVGADACGVASDVIVDVPRAQGVNARTSRAAGSRWHAAPETAFGVFLGGSWANGDALAVSWGRRTPGGVRALRSGLADLSQASPGSDPARWRFVADWSLPSRPRTADMVRITPRPLADRSGVLVSAPIAYSRLPLSALLSGRGTQSLVSPYLFEATPCARTMRLADGAAEVPRVLVDSTPVPSFTTFSSPVLGLSDVLTLERMPLEPAGFQGPIFVYRPSSDPGDAIVPPRMTVIRQ